MSSNTFPASDESVDKKASGCVLIFSESGTCALGIGGPLGIVSFSSWIVFGGEMKIEGFQDGVKPKRCKSNGLLVLVVVFEFPFDGPTFFPVVVKVSMVKMLEGPWAAKRVEKKPL